MGKEHIYDSFESMVKGKCTYEYYNKNTGKYSKKRTRICHIKLNGVDEYNSNVVCKIFTVREYYGEWGIHSESGSQNVKSTTKYLRDTAVNLADKNNWKYFAIGIVGDNDRLKNLDYYEELSNYAISIESYTFGDNTCNLAQNVKELKENSFPDIFRTKLTFGDKSYPITFIKKDKFLDYISSFDNRTGETIVIKVEEPEDNEKLFVKWLSKQGKDPESGYVKKMVSFLSSAGSKYYVKPIFTVTDYKQFMEIAEKIRTNPNFEKDNRNIGSGAPSAALTNYCEFLKETKGMRFTQRISAEEQEKGFINWFKSLVKTNGEPYDEKSTIATYVRRLKQGFEHYINLKKWDSFFDIQDLNSFLQYVESVKNQPDFNSFNMQGGRYSYSSALKKYEEYLKYVETGSVEPEEIDNLEDEPYKSVPMIPRQEIVYGAPGTSKSFTLEKEIEKKYTQNGELDENQYNKHLKRVIFHPEYSYGDFIGSIQPVRNDNGKLEYEFTKGPFVEMLEDCFLAPSEEFFLVIEELNRGNAAAIFGDVFQLLDRVVLVEKSEEEVKRLSKRERQEYERIKDNQGNSRYKITSIDIAKRLNRDFKELGQMYLADMFDTDIGNDKIWLPSNFNIVCTMNTADQNVFILDSAFKRRFAMKYSAIDFDLLAKKSPELTKEAPAFSGKNNELKIDDYKNDGLNVSVKDMKRNWPTFAILVNSIIDRINEESGIEQISEDKKLGPYFVSENDIKSKENFVNKVIYYLKQDVFKYVESYFSDSFQTIYQKAQNGDLDVFEYLKKKQS